MACGTVGPARFMGSPNDVVVTGLGLVTPLGIGVEATRAALASGATRLRPPEPPVPSTLPIGCVGAVSGLDPEALLENSHKSLKFMSRDAELGVCAGRLAWIDAGLQGSAVDPEGVGLYVGAGLEPRLIADYADPIAASQEGPTEPFDPEALLHHGLKSLDPATMLRSLSNMVAAHISIELGLRGPNSVPTPHAASGALALGRAIDAIREGDADVVLAGAADAKCDTLGLVANLRLGILSASPAAADACAPLTERACGTALGEGAAILVLERRDHAEARHARIYATLRGFGEVNRAPAEHGDTAEAAGFARAMQRALDHAGVGPEAIDLVHPDAGGLRRGDAVEAEALAAVFGGSVPSVFSVKPQSGHLLAAAAPWATAVLALILGDAVPPYPVAGPARVGIGFDPWARRNGIPKLGLVNAWGLSGVHASLVVEAGNA